MTGTDLIRPLSSIAWEMRRAWATGRRVALSLDARCNVNRIEGWVRTVAATDAFVVVNGRHIPLDAVLAVHLPSILGDSNWNMKSEWHGPARQVRTQREMLWEETA